MSALVEGVWRRGLLRRNADLDFCIFPVTPPEGQAVKAFCQLLELGVIGYSWQLEGSNNDVQACE